MSSFKSCKVCNDTALGYNFKVITCESCKAFFRRSALARGKKYICAFNQKCDITVETRRFCQRCRLNKCFDVGMKFNHIMSEKEKLMRRRKIENTHFNRKILKKTQDHRLRNITQQFLEQDQKNENFIINPLEKIKDKMWAAKMSGTELLDYILSDQEKASEVIHRLMKTSVEAILVVEKIIIFQKDALRLISHLISYPGDALLIISKIMNSPFEALSVFIKFMSSPTDGLDIIIKIMNSPQHVLDFMKHLMQSPEDALNAMEHFMNSPAETLNQINNIVNDEKLKAQEYRI